MARAPDRTDLIRGPRGGGTPELRVTRPYDGSDQAIAAQYGGIRDVLTGLGKLQYEMDKVDDFEAKRKLADFRLDTERELEEKRRTMPAGGANFSGEWQKHYNKRATGFVKELPEDQRDKVQDGLVSNYERLQREAQNAELRENEKYKYDSLVGSLDKQVTGAMSRPDNLDEFRVTGLSLIESANLAPDVKRSLAENYGQRLESSVIQNRINAARSTAELRKLQADINAQETAAALPVFEGGKRVPTSEERRAIFRNGGVVVNLDTNWSPKGRTNPLVVIPNDATPEQRAQAQAYADSMREVYKKVLGVDVETKVVTRSQNGRGRPFTIHTEPFAVTDKNAVDYFKSDEGRKVHASILRSTLGKISGVQFSLPHNKEKGDRGAHGSGTNEVELAELLLPELTGGSVAGGSYRALSSEQRQQFNERIAAQHDRMIKKIDGRIKQVEENSILGISLSEPQLSDLKTAVDETEDDYLRTRLQSTLDLAKTMKQLQQNPPEANAVAIARLRAEHKEKGATPEQEERLQKYEKMYANQVQMLKTDAITYANNTGVIERQPLHLGDPNSLQTRMEHARKTQEKFGGQLQFFTKGERESFAQMIDNGQLPVSRAAAALVQSLGNEGATVAMQQIAKDAPAAALVGGHVATFGKSLPVIEDYEEGHKLLKKKEYKSVGITKADARDAISSVIGDVVAGNPTMAAGLSDTIMSAANKAYEVRARRQGLQDFDPYVYRQTVRELLGEREAEGIKYGGISGSKSGWLWSSDPVIVPHDVRQDAFDELRGMIKVDMLPSTPLNKRGKPIEDKDLAAATLVSLSAGYYAVIARPETGEPYYDSDGQPYVLNFNDVRDRLKALRPDYFYPTEVK